MVISCRSNKQVTKKNAMWLVKSIFTKGALGQREDSVEGKKIVMVFCSSYSFVRVLKSVIEKEKFKRETRNLPQ